MAILHSPQLAAIVIERLDLMANGKFWKNSDTVGGAKEAVEQSADAAQLPSGWVVESLLENIAAAREWIGLVVYRMTGRTAELFPAP